MSAQEVVDFSDPDHTINNPSWLKLVNPGHWCRKIIYAVESFCTDFSLSVCTGTMLAYAFLYFTVLSFGSLMTVYLMSIFVGPDYPTIGSA